MDTITLRRSISGEYCDRVYEMTGGAFAEMLAAVKGLAGYHKFDGRAWRVKKGGLEELSKKYRVVEMPLLAAYPYSPHFVRTIVFGGREATLSIHLRVRDDADPSGYSDLKAKEILLDVPAGVTDQEIVGVIAPRAYAETVAELQKRFEEALGGKRDTDSVVGAIRALYA